MEAIGTCSLELSSGFIFQLEKNLCVLIISRNLILTLALVPFGISCNFSDICFNFLIKSKVIRVGTLCDGLYLVHLQGLIVGIKWNVMNEESSLLWYWRLEHIFIQRIKRLVNEGVLSTLDFTNFETCLDCIKGKQTNKSKKGATRSKHC